MRAELKDKSQLRFETSISDANSHYDDNSFYYIISIAYT